jgi:putative ABC transport system permease protein
MTMLTVLHVMTQDPLPGRSAVLYAPWIDPRPLGYQDQKGYGNAADNFSWTDAMALLEAHRATHQAAMGRGWAMVWPARPDALPDEVNGRFTTAEFFDLFDVPMARGRGWSVQDDRDHARVVVLSQAVALQVFGDVDPVGREVRFEDATLRVIGVTGPWSPHPLFYDSLTSKGDAGARGAFGEQDGFFVPLNTALDLDLNRSGRAYGLAVPSGTPEPEDELRSPYMLWLQVWLQLDSPAQAQAYSEFLRTYVGQQHAAGRFELGPENVKLYGLMDWLRYQDLVPRDMRLQLVLAVGFFCICLVNIVALLLAKFLRRSGEVGVRRALGARRMDVFLQLGTEAMLIGVLGGALGVLVAQLGLWNVRQRPDSYAQLARMDGSMLFLAVVTAIVAALLAGLLPAWRASRIAPALQIKAL